MPYIEKEQNLINDTFIDVRKLFLNILYLVLEKKNKKISLQYRESSI